MGTGADRTADLVEVADDVWRLSRAFDRIRTQVVADTGQVTDYTSLVLLIALSRFGPRRSGALADAVHSDASTVSRQVAALVARGLAERRADPEDGRVIVLAATGAGRTLAESKLAHRDEQYALMLEDWTGADVAMLARLLRRLATDHERHMQSLLTGHPGCRTVPTARPQP
jgi:DNA-binding MarR family transcriptional regulator